MLIVMKIQFYCSILLNKYISIKLIYIREINMKNYI